MRRQSARFFGRWVQLVIQNRGGTTAYVVIDRA
jgi:hypothetical protein